MEKIKLTVESFKFLIYNKFIPVFDDEINMELADKILDRFDHIMITRENCMYGISESGDEFIKHKNNAFPIIQKIIHRHPSHEKLNGSS